MSLKRKALITVKYDRARHTYTSLGAYLVLRETRNGLKFFIEMITTGGFLHQAGVRENDRLVSVNFADIDGLDFDNLLDAIKCLMPLMFGIERDVDGTIIPIVSILEVAVGDDLNPIASFIGFFWNTTVDAITRFIPLDVPALNTYTYVDQEDNVTLKTTTDGQDRWLSVDGDEIPFTTTFSLLSLFTIYRYVKISDPDPRKTPVILSPTSQSNQCMSATRDNVLKLESFDPVVYDTQEGRLVASDERFFLQEQRGTQVVFESSCVEGYYIAQDEYTGNAIMSTNPALFNPPHSVDQAEQS